MPSDTPGYSPAVSAFIERRLLNRVETPEALQVDIAKALARNHGLAAYEYEERYIKIHHPTRQCPACGSVEQLQVVTNHDTGERTRCCPACDAILQDEHVAPEVREILVDSRVRRNEGGLGSYV